VPLRRLVLPRRLVLLRLATALPRLARPLRPLRPSRPPRLRRPRRRRDL